MLAPGRSALLGGPAEGLNGAAGVEHIWCARPCCMERDSDCFGDSDLLRGAQGMVVVQVAYLQSVTVQMLVLLWFDGIEGHSSSQVLSAQPRKKCGSFLHSSHIYLGPESSG